MKYETLIYNLRKLEKEENQIFLSIDLVEIDFYNIAHEMNFKIEKDETDTFYFKDDNDLIYFLQVETNFLKKDFATFADGTQLKTDIKIQLFYLVRNIFYQKKSLLLRIF